MSNESNYLYEFGDYVLNARERNLWLNAELVKMPAKAFDTLCMLVERHGETLSKDEMLEAVWEGSFVEENNLSQKISMLRRLFGKENDFIKTIPKKGYRFVAPVKSSHIEAIENEVKVAYVGTVNPQENSSSVSSNGISATDTENSVEDLPNTESVGHQTNSKSLVYALGGIILTFVLGFFAYSFFYSNQTDVSKTPAASFDYLELTDTGDIDSSAISPDGKSVVFIKTSHDKTISSLRVMDIESKNDVEIRVGGSAKPGVVKFSPDGKSIFFRTSGNKKQFEKIYRISRFGGDPKLVAENIWGSFSFSPDGAKLTYFYRELTGLRQQIAIKDIETGKQEMVQGAEDVYGTRARGAPIFSPDQKKVAFIQTQRTEKGVQIAIVDLETSHKQVIDTELYSIRELVWKPDGKSFYVNALKLGKSFQIWNVAIPDGELTRVTSDSDSYRSLSIANDGTISVNRLNMYSNIWLIPQADVNEAQQLTRGENEAGGLFTAQFVPNGNILYNARDKMGAGIRVLDIEGKTTQRFIDKQLATTHHFTFSKSKKIVFFVFENRIWKANFDGSEAEKVELGDATRILNPSVSFDEKWLFYIKREKDISTIWKAPIEGGKAELVAKPDGFSPETFLTASPDGKYLAFVYVTLDKIGDEKTISGNFRRFGFLNLETNEVTSQIVPAYRSVLRWTNKGKTFDFPGYTKKGTAIYRQNVEGNQKPLKVFGLENERIYRFDWSSDQKNLVIGRGNHKMNIVILKVMGAAQSNR